MNGQDRFYDRDVTYFRLVQPYNHHTRIPMKQKIYCYSFALFSESHQPSGSCNFSRLDNVSMIFTDNYDSSGNSTRTSSDELLVFAIGYNVLRVMSGMAGLAYTN